MGVNVILFVVVQIGLEPWRRKRLVRGFEEKVREAVKEIPQSDMNMVIRQVEQPERPVEIVIIGEEKVEEPPAEEDNQEITEIVEETVQTNYEGKDIWISAAGGAVVGGLLTALGTWIISR